MLADGHPLEAGVRPQAVQAEQQPLLQGGPVHALEGRGAAEGVAEADAQVGLLEHVEQAGHRPPSRQVRLEGAGGSPARAGAPAWTARSSHRPWAGSARAGSAAGCDPRSARASVISRRTWATNASASLGELQGGIVGGPLRVEVGGQILVGVAVAVGALDPDLLAAESLAEGLQHADLVGDAVDARVAVLVRLQDGFLPGAAHHALQRDLLVGRVGSAPCCRRTSSPAPGREDRLVRSCCWSGSPGRPAGAAPCGGSGSGRSCG